MDNLIRTPDHCFENLPGYDFIPRYVEINGARMHYIAEGKGEIILCIHGEPTWSYMYRKFYPVLTQDYRVIAPDLLGFGKSDKYTNIKDYSYKMHYESLLSFIRQLDLKNVTLVVHDWGGLLGLAVLAKLHHRFSRVVILNTFLPIGNRSPSFSFKLWQAFAKFIPKLPVGGIVNFGTVSKQLDSDVKAAYNAPFPDESYKAGARAFPSLVPSKSDQDGVAEMKFAREILSKWNKPALVLFSDKDPILSGAEKFFRALIPSAKNQPVIQIKGASHFLAEEKGEEIAQHIKAFMIRTTNDNIVD